MTDYCRYADVFYGNGQVTQFPDKGLASKWFFIKAQCGNTYPHATLPFGRMSAGAYSGGYPTGYGTHYPNTCGGIKKLSDRMTIRGFSHLHQSGTGAIGFYYNYAVVTPFYGDIGSITRYYPVYDETARPGYYSVCFNGVKCALTVNKDTAYHSYDFENDGGKIAVDMSNDGLSKIFGEKFYGKITEPRLEKTADNCLYFSGIMAGIKLYFCVKAEGEDVSLSIMQNCTVPDSDSCSPAEDSENYGGIFAFTGKHIELKVSYSTISCEKAKEQINALTDSFEETVRKAYEVWNEYLSRIDIKTDDEELKLKFYSNLYHSLVKPAMFADEEIMGVKGDTVYDIGTFWDQYKTLFPLMFAVCPEEGKALADCIVNISRTMGKIPNNFGLSTDLDCEGQAKMLGIITLCEAYYASLVSKKDLDDCTRRELARDELKRFVTEGFADRYTHILDASDACIDVSRITDDCEFAEYLAKLGENMKNAYSEDGLMSDDSPYYEGDRYTYSFRLHPDMDSRIEIAGGKEKLSAMLDSFFGFDGESVEQVTDTDKPYEKIAATHYHRFEGFNNECDMETPFAYAYTGDYDKLCDIIHEAVTVSFTTGTGAIPGNNDSGGLSSLFVWFALGLFPAVGTGKYLFGCPHIDSAVIKLANGSELVIEVNRSDKNAYRVKEVFFNGIKCDGIGIDTKTLLGGGTLMFTV